MGKRKLLMITENTVIRLYEKHLWNGYDDITISVMVVDEIIKKLTQTKNEHPLRDLYTSEEDKGPFYELVHFVFSTIEDYAKTRPHFSKKK